MGYSFGKYLREGFIFERYVFQMYFLALLGMIKR